MSEVEKPENEKDESQQPAPESGEPQQSEPADTPQKTYTLNGVPILPRYVGMEIRKLDMSGKDADYLHYRLLQYYNMPFDLHCLFFTIDGEGIGEPDYMFQLIGIIPGPNDGGRHDIKSTRIFSTFLRDTDGIPRRLSCYVWQRIVILKSRYKYKSYCAETHNGSLLFIPPSPLQEVVDSHVSSHLPPEVRWQEMDKLTRGYAAMLDLFNNMNKPCKHTPDEAEKLADEITEAARHHIARWVRQKDRKGPSGARSVRNIISFKSIAAAIGKSHNTLNAINYSLISARLKSLESRFKEIEQQEREASTTIERKFLKGS